MCNNIFKFEGKIKEKYDFSEGEAGDRTKERDDIEKFNDLIIKYANYYVEFLFFLQIEDCNKFNHHYA